MTIKKINFEQLTYYSLLLFAFALPLSRAANSFFVFFLLLLVLLKRDYKTSWQTLKENSIFLYIALFIGYLYLSALWSSDIDTLLKQLRMYGYWMVIPCFVILAKKEWMYAVLNAFLLGMFISEILAYGIWLEWWSFNGRDASYPTPFMTHIHYSVFLAFTSLVLFYRFLFEQSSLKVRVPMFLFFVLTTINLMISTGRTGQLAFFVTLFLVFVVRYRLSLKSLVLSIVFGASIIALSYQTLPLFQKRADAAIHDVKKILNENYNTSFGVRAAWWIITYDALKEEPVLGYGLGDYNEAAKNAVATHQYEGLSAHLKKYVAKAHYHNQYLMVAVQGGLLGLALMFLLFYKLLRLPIQDKELKHLSVIAFVVFLVAFVGEPLWILQFPLMLFVFTTGLFITAAKRISG